MSNKLKIQRTTIRNIKTMRKKQLGYIVYIYIYIGSRQASEVMYKKCYHRIRGKNNYSNEKV